MTNKGLPVFTLSQGSTYTFDHELRCWWVQLYDKVSEDLPLTSLSRFFQGSALQSEWCHAFMFGPLQLPTVQLAISRHSRCHPSVVQEVSVLKLSKTRSHSDIFSCYQGQDCSGETASQQHNFVTEADNSQPSWKPSSKCACTPVFQRVSLLVDNICAIFGAGRSVILKI